MATKTRAQLIAANDALFTANGNKEITGPLVNTFNDDCLDSIALVSDDNDFTGVNNHTKEVRWHKGADLAAATSINLGVTGNFHHITGNTTIEGLSTKQHGTVMRLYFEGTPLLTHSTALILPNAEDIQIITGDSATFISEGSGNWRMVEFLRNIPTSANFTPTLSADNTVCTAVSGVQSSYVKNGPIINVLHVISVDLDFSAGSTGTVTLSDLPFTAPSMAGGGYIEDPSTTPVNVFLRGLDITFLNNSGTETFSGLRVNILGQSTV